MKGYYRLRAKAIELLERKLTSKLTYHGINHTYYVLKAANRLISKAGNISNHQKKLIRVAVLYHDIGFINGYYNHEEEGVKVLEPIMEELGCSKKDFNIIAGMILATKIPQSPKTKLEKIICDADLYYLGTSEYYEISDTLFQELKKYNILRNKKQWTDVQIKFLSKHKYFTAYAKKHLSKEKSKRLKELLNGQR